MVNGVDLDSDSRLLREGGGHVGHCLLRDGVRIVGAEGDGPGEAAWGSSGSCRRIAASGKNRGQDGQASSPKKTLLENFPTRDLAGARDFIH